MSPLAYAAGYTFAEFDYATADEVFDSANPSGVSESLFYASTKLPQLGIN
jgi:hypothetical protein